jgi:pimeloyl-ACP methyl ester carboxylesterase
MIIASGSVKDAPLVRSIDRSQLHVFGRFGHRVQIEHAGRFNRLVADFLSEGLED